MKFGQGLSPADGWKRDMPEPKVEHTHGPFAGPYSPCPACSAAQDREWVEFPCGHRWQGVFRDPPTSCPICEQPAASTGDKIRGLLGGPPMPALPEHEDAARAATEESLAARNRFQGCSL